MYETAPKPRRSWTGRLKDRFRSSSSAHHSGRNAADELADDGAAFDDWTWASKPHMEGHHAPSVASLHGGSVFVAANFVYDYRLKYGVDRKSSNGPHMTLQAVPSSPESSSSYSSACGRSRSRASRPSEESQFRAADVNQNIRRRVQSASRRNKKSPEGPEDDEDLPPPETTVAVDRPGLVVSGQRICILTGEEPVIRADEGAAEAAGGKVSLRVEFQRGSALRRSLSESRRRTSGGPNGGGSRVVIRPAVQFHDTTRLMVKSRSRGSIQDLFDSEPFQSPPPLPTSPPPALPGGTLRRTISRPVDPPPPPPTSDENPPVAPPRRIYRNPKTVISSGGSSPTSTAAVMEVNRPVLQGQMVSWSAWSSRLDEQSGAVMMTTHQNHPAERMHPLASSVIGDSTVASRRSNTSRVPRRPVSRLWPSFSTIGRSNSRNRNKTAAASALPPEEHIYEEIDDSHGRAERIATASNSGASPTPATATTPAGIASGCVLSRTGRGGSFAGATRQDILRYLDELRRKHPSGVIDAEAVRSRALMANTAAAAAESPAADADEAGEDAQMGALLLAMRHNASSARTSNRSTGSSTSSSGASSEVLPVSPSPQEPLMNAKTAKGSGEVLERNDSGVGSDTGGPSSSTTTAQQRRLRRLRRLKIHLKDEEEEEEEEGLELTAAEDHRQVEAVVASSWCVDCDQLVEPEGAPTGSQGSSCCTRCARRRSERREVLAELLETEVRYGRDLRVLQEELYKPLLVAGLVPLRQLDAVFLNVSELSGHSSRFGQRLKEAVEAALENGDEDLLTVDVARLFLDRQTEEMMDAFRRYCVRSGEASVLLSSLEKERELLRIFLKASQLENPALRRMDLHAFLMVPVQRITKYPLLLGRLLRATAQQDVEMRRALREAQAKVESYLTAINAEAKELGDSSTTTSRTIPAWRRGYSVPNLNLSLNSASANSPNSSGPLQVQQPSRPTAQELMNLRLRKMALDSLGWDDSVHANTTRFILDGQVKVAQPSDLLLTASRAAGAGGRTSSSATATASRGLKWQNVWVVLVAKLASASSDKSSEMPEDSGGLNFGLKSSVDEAALVLMKDAKSPRPGPSLYRGPLLLSQCTVNSEPELGNMFEVHQVWTKESLMFQATDSGAAQRWLHSLRTLSLSLGQWRKRRNALPHVMMMIQ